MSAVPLEILSTGLVTSVGLSASAACAAMRAKVTNPTPTRFIDSRGEWIVAHQVPLEEPWRGLPKLVQMVVMAIDEALSDVSRSDWPGIPLLLCVAEPSRPGRLDGLDDQLFGLVERELETHFAAQSAIVAHGKVGIAVALSRVRELIRDENVQRVLVAAVDSFVSWPTLLRYESNGRLLGPTNSNGFMPGEGAGAMLVGKGTGRSEIVCTGIGFGVEAAHLDSGEPLRADGLTAAIRAALADAGCAMHALDYRITDLSGEQYYFKEAALALSRTLRTRKAEFDLWHPAECTGETGAVAGAAIIALADAALRKGFGAGPAILGHMANDAGQRAAVVLRLQSA
jgi:3-oxoacyl-[acyl-carrier-protein] synthase-1